MSICLDSLTRVFHTCRPAGLDLGYEVGTEGSLHFGDLNLLINFISGDYSSIVTFNIVVMSFSIDILY